MNFSISISINRSDKISLRPFHEDFGYLSKNSALDDRDSIYRENDTQAAGNDTFGDRLTTVTVRNNGTLPADEINTVTLAANGTTIANDTQPSNGTWVLEPDPTDAWFGPAGNGTQFTLHADVADTATGGKTVALRVPAVKDTGTQGSFDPGDTGLFFEQDAPIGQLGPGTTLTVEATETTSSTSDTTTDESPTPVRIAIGLPATNLTTDDASIPITIRTNATDRTLTVDLRRVDTDSTVARHTVTTDETGWANVSFKPRPGRFRVVVREVDSGSTARSELFTVSQPSAVNFVNETYAVSRGQIGTVSVALRHTESATLILEGPTGHTIAGGTVRDMGGEHTKRIRLNTTALGAGPIASGLDAGSNASLSPPQSKSQPPGKAGSARNGTPAGNRTAPSRPALPSAVRPRTPGRPLGAGQYTLTVSAGENSSDTATLRITEDWTGTVQTFVAPADSNLTDLQELGRLATERSTIAAGDTLIVAVNTSGLPDGTLPSAGERRSAGGTVPVNETGNATEPGGLPDERDASAASHSSQNRTKSRPPAAAEANASAWRRGNRTTNETPIRSFGQGAYATLRPADGAESGSGPVATTSFRSLRDPGMEMVYLVQPPAAELGEQVTPGERYGARFVLDETSPVVPGLATNGTVEREAVGHNFTVVEPRATITAVSGNDSLKVRPRSNVSFGGETTVAPGTTVTVHLNGSDSTDETTETTTVDEDGTYETDLDTSEYDGGTRFTVSATANGEQLSPVRTGEFVPTETEEAQAQGAAGGSLPNGSGGDGGGGSAGSSGTETTPRSTTGSTTDMAKSPTTEDEHFPGGGVGIRALRKNPFELVPDRLRLGPDSLVTAIFGIVSLVFVWLGVRRLT